MTEKYKGKKRNPASRTSHLRQDPLDTFFAQYPAFNYQPNASSTEEFYRMCDLFGWDREDFERVAAHDDFKTALVRQFNCLYGTEVDDIQSWRGLCLALQIYPLPDKIVEAKKVFKGKFVNLVDLVDTKRTGNSITQFNSLEGLQEYTIRTGKYFPKESAYAGGVLKFLLREILNVRRVGGTH
ncbi:MAG: hypothetical protein M1816_002772 [Peltula sp. TS41687]|nr:MAG: hypothetical protein M1816_002772 [Peltula sp. TS41687]